MIRTIDFRVDVLKNGIRAGSIKFDTREPPTVSCDADAEIKTGMSGTFAQSDLINYLNDELQPVIIINGTEYPAGVFQAGAVKENTAAGVTRYEVEAYDRAMRLSWRKLEARAYHEPGETYSSIIAHYLVDAGIVLYNLTPTDATLAAGREWDVGTSYLTIINELLSELAYDPIWFNASGTAILRPYQAPSVALIDHRYGSGSAQEYRRIASDYSKETDIFSKPNVFIVIRSGPDYETPLVATAENDFIASPLSVTRRGIRIPVVYQVDNIADQDALQSYTNRIRNRSMEASEVIRIATAIQPGHGVNDVVAIEDNALPGIYRESAWSFTMAAGSWMTHTLQRSVLQLG